ncbi:hypothetical protein [Paenibacillus sp. MBLB4367]|uniref:hypothetical protein n=1 Tax=Paenibacillus sp. MBLB4367 TaxID=3384767 RepID=UPI0039080FE2
MQKNRLTKAILIAAAIVTASGCSSISVPDGEGGKTDISVKGNDITVKSKDGEGKITVNDKDNSTTIKSKDANGNASTMTFSEDKKLPDGFPKDIPVPEKAQITGSMSTSADKEKSFMVTFQSKQSIKDAGKAYHDALKAAGFTDLTETSADDFYIGSGQKDGIRVSISIASGSAKDVTELVLTALVQ